MFLPCDSWGRKGNSEKTLENCNFSLRLHAHPLRAPAGNPRAGTGRGAHWVEGGHRYRADWGSGSESEAGPRLPTRTGHCRWWGAEAVCLDSPGRSGAKEDRGLYPRVSVCPSAGQALGRPSRGRGTPGQLFHRRPESADQPGPSRRPPSGRPSSLPGGTSPDLRAHAPRGHGALPAAPELTRGLQRALRPPPSGVPLTATASPWPSRAAAHLPAAAVTGHQTPDTGRPPATAALADQPRT